MITLLSPAKSLNFEESRQIGLAQEPHFLAQAQGVQKHLSRFSAVQLQKLQHISEELAELNYQRNQQWRAEDHLSQGRQAALAFTGDVYQGMEAEHWSEEDMQFASEHLRILSGLYGLLRPNDLILPYRLEMGTRKLGLPSAPDLATYWAPLIQEYAQQHLDPNQPVVNLASQEYFKAWAKTGLNLPVIEPVFKDQRRGQYRVISFFAKKARGMMANFIVQNRIDRPNDLKDFTLGSYYFDPKSSTAEQFTFLRDSE